MESNKETTHAVVTGASGFLGRCLVKNILQKGGTVAAITHKVSNMPKHPRLVEISGNLSDVSDWYEDLKGFEPNVFYHLAWRGVSNKLHNDTIQVSNVESSIETLRLSSKLGCMKWVGLGSLVEYGPSNKCVSENDKTNPATIYAASKLSVGLLATLLGVQLGIETAWVRMSNIYGPGNGPGWMLSDLIIKLLRGQTPPLTLGKQRWDYIYVEDAAEAVAKLGMTKASGIFNLGSGRAETVRYIAETVRDIIDPSLKLGFGEVPYSPNQIMLFQANIERLSTAINWLPKTNLKDGLRRAVKRTYLF